MKLISAESRYALKSFKGVSCLILIVISLAISLVTLLSLVGQIGQPFVGFRVEPTLTVSAINESYWPGPKAGMETYDRIIKMNGKPVLTPEELFERASKIPMGTEIEYTLLPKGSDKEKTVKIPVKPFTTNDFTRSFLTIYIVGLLHLLVGSLAYLRQPENPAARAHLFVTLTIGMTSILPGDYDTVMLFPRVWIATVALTGAACLHLGMYFPQKKKIVTRKPWLVYIPYAISFLFVGIWEYAFRPLGYMGYKSQNITDLFDLHFLMNDLSLAWSLGVGFIGLFIMIMHSVLKSESLLIRNQAKVALIGALVAYLPMTVWLISEIGMGFSLGTSAATLAWMMFIVFPISVAYAIIKHKMFDIEFILRQSMTYTALITLLGGGYILMTTGLQQILQPLMARNGDLTAYMVTTAIAVVLFEPLKINIRAFIDTKFFRSKYDFRTAISDFTDTARSTINMDDLIPKLVDIMENTIHPKHILLFLKDKENNTLKQVYNYGIDIQLKDAIPLNDLALLQALGLNKQKKRRTANFTSTLSLTNDLRADAPIPSPLPFLLAKRITAQLPKLEEMEAISNSLTLPLTVKIPIEGGSFKDELIGLLTLGEKRSELEYTIEDRQLFQSIGQQLALTLHGSHLADDVAEKEALKQNLLKARMIQHMMLPNEEMALSHFDVTGFSESADETGGDYYDWYDLGEGRFIVGLGDVTGHGIDAAMIVSMAKSCLYNQVLSNPEVPEVMAALNRTLNSMVVRAKKRQDRKLMSFIYSYFDTQNMTCKMASAGHWYPYHYSAATGELTNFPDFKGTFPLGQRPAEKFKCNEQMISVAHNDILLYFTDGLHEAANTHGEEYGFERIEQLLHWYKDLSAYEIKSRMQEDWENHIQGQGMDDDMTMVIIKVKPSPPSHE